MEKEILVSQELVNEEDMKKDDRKGVKGKMRVVVS